MISVVIPAFNEAASVATTVQTIKSILRKAGYEGAEVIVVDDGSTDDTFGQAKKSDSRVLRNLQNMGYGFSLKRGIRTAKYDTIAIIDADGTYPLERLPDLLKAYEEGYHMVVGARTGEHYWESSLKGPLRLLLKYLVEFTAGRRIPDVNSGFRVFSKQEIIFYFPHLSNTFSFTTTSTLAYILTNRYIKYLPIDYMERVGSTKVRLFRDSLRVLQQIVETALHFNPFKIFLTVVFVILISSIVSIALGLIMNIVSAVWLGIGLIVVSVIVFAIGLFAQAGRNLRDYDEKDRETD